MTTEKNKARIHVLSELFAAFAPVFVFAFAFVVSFALHLCSRKNTCHNVFIKDSVSPTYIGKRYQKKRIDKIHETQHYPDKHVNVYLATCRENGVHKLLQSSPQCCSPCRCVTRGRHGGTARSTSA